MCVEEAEKLLEIMGYSWEDHYDNYSEFVQNLSETIDYNFNI
jgi:hypothetical protein